jgi:triose/dihydroxyacetone kinase / FAD-AMP lyase (cyclizing)
VKKLLNEIHSVVPEMLAGVSLLNPGVSLLEGWMIAVRSDVEELKLRHEVALISGGGSGHEPAHAGYVGPGMLTAAVAGDVFTSPSVDAVLAAIDAVSGSAGVLLVVKNYTGDRLNFGLAAEIAKSQGHHVDMVVVDDDASLSERGEHAGRRGIAGTVLVHKVAGAAAATGASLQQVKAAAEKAIHNLSSMGIGLSACTVPAAGGPGFELGPDEVELGLGIHGEQGVRRAPIDKADALIATILDTLSKDLDLQTGDPVVVLVNNLGGTPTLELNIVAYSAIRQLAQRGLVIHRCWSGTFLTALEMAGVSISLMKVDDVLLSALDAPADTTAWSRTHTGLVQAQASYIQPKSLLGSYPSTAVIIPTAESQKRQVLLLAVAAALEAAEEELTQLDQLVGDGDLGISLTRGSKAIRDEIKTYPLEDWPSTLQALSATLRKSLGGTSGPLYAIGLLGAADSLKKQPGLFGQALKAATEGIAKVGGACQGDRTMLDALIPAADTLIDAYEKGHPALKAIAYAVDSAHYGTVETAHRVARQGRSSYLGKRALGHVDPGARAVVIWLQAIAQVLSEAKV